MNNNNNIKKKSKEHIIFLKNQKNKKNIILITQISIFILFLIFWELVVKIGWADIFLISSPCRIIKTILNLNNNNQLWDNIFTTFFETIFTFVCSSLLGFFFATILWWFDFIEKISRPYLVVLNALPKIALGPIVIIWAGAGFGAIICISLLMSVIITTLNISSGFKEVDKEKILLMKTFGANKFQIFKNIIFPINIPNIIWTLRINIGMSLIGVITGEFLVSKKGIGYLIIYASQVFKIDLIISGIIMLALMALLFYKFISKIENIFY